MSLYSFQAAIYARPPSATSAGTITIVGREVEIVDVPQGESGRGFERTFEDVAERFGCFERMFFEPDGSFVWVAGGEPAWQLDGVVYDRNDRVLFVDVKGTCPQARLDELLSALGWPETPVLFQLSREAVFLTESTFRAFATTPAA